MTESSLLFADLELSRRLERAEALSNSRFVDARARLAPDGGATWVEVAGARSMFDGSSSPMTQTFGLGLFQPATAAALDAIEAFYAERASPVLHEVSPLADAGPPSLLSERGYRPFEFSSVGGIRGLRFCPQDRSRQRQRRGTAAVSRGAGRESDRRWRACAL